MTTTAIEKNGSASAGGLAAYLNDPRVRKGAADLLPNHITVERMAKIVGGIVKQSKQLVDVANKNPASLLKCFIQASELGLEPGLLGHCYIVPFRDDGKPSAQLIIGYKGYIELSRRSGQLRSVHAYPVHEKDEFAFQLGLNPDIVHIPAPGSPEYRGAITNFYSVAKLKNGGEQFRVMDKSEVDAIRQKSPGRNSGAWKNHYPEMGCKTVFRALAKWLPMSTDFRRAEAIDLDARSEVEVIDSDFSLATPTDELESAADAIEGQLADAQSDDIELACPDHGAIPMGETQCPDCNKPGEPKSELFDTSANEGAFE